MGKERLMSRCSKVYHNPYCHHARRIKNKNEFTLPWWEARRKGYQPCKCCCRLSYYIDYESLSISYFKKRHGMEFRYKKDALYVRTEIGCWKIMYSKNEEKMLLFHRSRSKYALNFKRAEKERYHVQEDALCYHTIRGVLQYIQDHDDFKKAESKGEKNIVFTKEIYKKQAERRKRKKKVNKVYEIFDKLEQDDKMRKNNSNRQ